MFNCIGLTLELLWRVLLRMCGGRSARWYAMGWQEAGWEIGGGREGARGGVRQRGRGGGRQREEEGKGFA